MATKTTTLSFTALNQSLWTPGFARGFRIDTGDSLIYDPAEVIYKLDVGALGFGVKADFYIDFKIGLYAYAELGNTGGFDTTFNIALNVGLPSAFVAGAGATFEFDFTKYTVTSGTIKSTGFAAAPKAGLDLILGVSAGLRNGEYYTWFDDGDFASVSLIDLDLSVPLISVDLNTPEFKFELTKGVTLTGRLPTGADTEGKSTGSSIVTGVGYSDTRFLELDADLDALLVRLVEKIPVVGQIVKGISEVVFAEHVFDIHDYIPFIPANKLKLSATVLDIGAGAGVVLKETTSVDIAGADKIPNVSVRLVSDNGTATLADDVIVNSRLGQKATIAAPTGGIGNVKVDAVYSLADVAFTHTVGLAINASFTIDALQAELGGSWVPSALAFSVGPLFSFEFPEGGITFDLFDLYRTTFKIQPNAFNTVQDSYSIFFTDAPPPLWNPEAANAAQSAYEYRDALLKNLASTVAATEQLWANSGVAQNVDFMRAGFNAPAPGANNTTRVWQGQFTSQADLAAATFNFTIVNPNAVPANNLRVNIGTTSTFGGPTVLASAAGYDAFFSAKLALLDALDVASPARLIFTYGSNTLDTRDPTEIVGGALGDLLVYKPGAKFFDGGAHSFQNDVFIASFRQSAPDTAIIWDLSTAATTGATVLLGNGVTVKNIEAFWLKTGNANDSLRTHTNQDVLYTGGGQDFIANVSDLSSDFIDAGDGDDVIVTGANGTFFALPTDTIVGGRGYDLAEFTASGGLRLDYSDDGALRIGGAGLGADAASLDLLELIFGVFEDVIEGSSIAQLDRNGTGDDAGDALHFIGTGSQAGRTIFGSSVEGIAVLGSGADDLVLFNGGAIYDGAGGNDTLIGDFASYETILGATSGVTIVAGPTGTATFGTSQITNFERLILTGTTLTDRMSGGAFADILAGEDGDDVIYGGDDDQSGAAQQDILAGGAGNDTFIWSNDGGDIVLGDDGVRSNGPGNDQLIITADGREVDGLKYTFFTNPEGRIYRDGVSFVFGVNNSATSILQALDLAADVEGTRAAGFVNTSFTVDQLLTYTDIETTNVIGSTGFNDLLIYENGASYVGGEVAGDRDTFAADFSGQATGITLVLKDDDTTGQRLENGVLIAGIDRAVVRAGTGGDVLTGASLDDYFHGGGGSDRLWGAGGNDELHGGDGNDVIYWTSDGFDTVTGGADDDRLIIGAAGGGLAYNFIGSGSLSASASADTFHIANALDFINTVTSISIQTGGSGSVLVDDSVEFIDVVGSDTYDDLVVYRGGLLYWGGEAGSGSDTDIFVANLSDRTEDLVLDIGAVNEAGTSALVDFGLGARVGGFERYVLRLGSGNDRVIGGDSQDYIEGGGGDDVLSSGGNQLYTETLLGGDGDDILEFGAGSAILDGGAGEDTVALEELGGDVVFRLRDAGGNELNAPGGLDEYAFYTELFEVRLPQTASVEYLIFDPILNTQFVQVRNVENLKMTASDAGGFFLAGAATATFIGGANNDTMISGGGNDLFVGLGENNTNFPDTYVFDENMGADLIAGDSFRGGKILFIHHTLAELSFSAVANDLRIEAKGGSVTVANYFAGGGNGLDYGFQTSDFNGRLDLSGLGAPGGGVTTVGVTVRGAAGDDDLASGSAFNDVVFGGDGDDFLRGGAGADVFDGGAGQDFVSYADTTDGISVDLLFHGGYSGAARGDVFAGIEGIVGSRGGNVLRGDGEDNSLIGANQADILEGRPGDDFLVGLAGNDTIFGDQGADELYGDEGLDTLYGGTGDDYLSGARGNDTMYGGDDDDVAEGGANNDLFLGEAGNDTLAYGGADDPLTAAYEDGLDTFDGGTGSDTVDFSQFGSAVSATLRDVGVAALLTRDTGSANGAEVLRTIVRVSDVENITGTEFDDRLVGNAFDNVLDGGEGDDVLIAGAGSDTYIGGAGVDTIDYSVAVGGFGAVLVDFVGAYALGEYQVFDSYYTFDKIAGVENFIGTAGQDAFLLDDANNMVMSGAADDTVTGGAGNDILNGGAGADYLEGGLDVDTVSYAGSSAVVVDLLTGAASGGDATGDVIFLFENIIGSDFNDELRGDAGSNQLNGGNGRDVLIGRGGDDFYYVSVGGESVIEAADEGNDTVFSFAPFNLSGQFAENVVLLGAADINATGNALDNVLTGNAGANELRGLGGNDTYVIQNASDAIFETVNNGTDTVVSTITFTLDRTNLENLSLAGTAAIDGTGNAGENILIGNTAVNVLRGLGGNDSYVVQNADDQVIELANGGLDTVFASVDFTLGSNIEDLVLTERGDIDGTGNAGRNTLRGNVGANVLDGGLGADVMIGGRGDDLYHVENAGDRVEELADEGFDRILTTRSYRIAAGLSIEALNAADPTSLAALNLTGNELNNVIGGNAGNNVLNGGGGIDTVSYANAAAGVLVFVGFINPQNTGGAGTDTLIGFENALGSAFDDGIAGTNGANVLDGGAGADDLDGREGNDRFIVDNAGDRVFESVGAGVDTVLAKTDYTLFENQEVEVLAAFDTAATSALALTGNNAFANTLYGNMGANTLDGGGGADRLYGYGGNDTFRIDNAADLVFEIADDGIDTLIASVNYTLRAGQAIEAIEANDALGTAAFVLTGNEFGQTIRGNLGSNVLRGGGGADVLYAGADNARDTFVYAAIADSGVTNATRDQIHQFDRYSGPGDTTADKIDLRLIDADPAAGQQALRFVTDFSFAPPGEPAGQLRVVTDGANAIVQIDANGDRIIDMLIEVVGVTTLAKADFLLASAPPSPAPPPIPQAAFVAAGSEGEAEPSFGMIATRGFNGNWAHATIDTDCYIV